MWKIVTLAGGVAGAATLSQYPEFTQQYLQRLAGQVDALALVARDFDASALEAGFGREAALDQMTGAPFLEARQTDMRATFARHARLAGDLDALRAATPMDRLAMPWRVTDTEIAAATWEDFRPAMPVTAAGAVSAGAGFGIGWLLVAGLGALCAWPLRAMRRRVVTRDTTRRRREPGRRAEPPVLRLVDPAPVPGRPRLMGERR